MNISCIERLLCSYANLSSNQDETTVEAARVMASRCHVRPDLFTKVMSPYLIGSAVLITESNVVLVGGNLINMQREEREAI